MSNPSDGLDRQNGEVTRQEMIADLRNNGWSEEDLEAIPDFTAS